jgi:hypothetical protein
MGAARRAIAFSWLVLRTIFWAMACFFVLVWALIKANGAPAG